MSAPVPVLLPCPFCGHRTAPIAIKTRPEAWWVRCDENRGGCSAEGPAVYYTRIAASEAWNTRPAVQA